MGLRDKSFLGFAGIAFLAGSLLAARIPDKLSDLQSRFDHEPNSVHKAKLLAKLSAAQFEETRRLEKLGDFNRVGILWEKYRDDARATFDALKKQHPDAERQSNGYRELEVGLREGIREIDQTRLIAPDEYRPPLLIVRGDLAAMDDEVLRMLFPRRSIDAPPAAASSETLP
jgi:hypothetical protein